MPTPDPARHILIDFENAPQTSLAPVAGMQVEITLLLGEKNKRLDAALVEDLLAAGPRGHLIRMSESGPNALDLTLAYYLGRAAATSPQTHFTIVSKDGDYDAMIRHARATGLQIERCDSVETLPFLKRPQQHAAPLPVRPKAERPAASPLDPRAEQIAVRLRESPKNRPARRTTLIRFIRSHLGASTTDDDAASVATVLEKDGCLATTPKGAVTYRI